MKLLYPIITTALLLSLASKSDAQTTVTVGSTTLDVREVITGIDIPWEIVWGPDDHIWFTERVGRISRLNPETGVRTVVLNLVGTVHQASESGMLGMALHPDFENTPHVYVAYTYLAGFNNIRERFVRYEYNGSTLSNPVTLIENIQGNTTHIGCRILPLPDNTLLFTTGDAQQASTLPQNINSLSGKVLRMNLDGSIPSDNPCGPDSYVYTLGHRNAQGMVLAPNGKIYSPEHGATTNDELNIIVPGGNYGWPLVEGFCNTQTELTNCAAITDNQEPIAIWYANSTIAPSDLIYYDHPSIPEWQGRLLMTVLKNKHLRAIKVDDADGTVVQEDVEYLTDVFGRLRDICTAPDGRVFLATNGPVWSNTQPNTHKIIELKNSAYTPVGADQMESGVLRVFPNPSSSVVSVELERHIIGGRLTLCDMMGREVISRPVLGSTHNMDVSHLAEGIYSIKVTHGGGIYSQRVVVKR
jgi:aldose sugar dehydrogenase